MTFWFKHQRTDKVWWEDDPKTVGSFVFSFDKKTKFNFWTDYPHKLTPEQKAIFDTENAILVKDLKG